MDRSSFLQSLIPLLAVNGGFLCLLAIFAVKTRNKPRSKFVEERHSSVILNKWIREYWIWITDPVVQFFIRSNWSPNTISFIGSILGVLAGAFYALGYIGLASWTMIFGASFDIFDGRVARETGRITKSGAFFDSVLDRISESCVFIGLAYYYRESVVFWFVMLASLGAMMTSYTKNRGNAMGVDYEGGLMQRPERIVYVAVSGIFLPVIAYLLYGIPAISSRCDLHTFIDGLYAVPLGFVALMTNLTTVDRIRANMRLLDAKQKSENS
jgi:CDP-diacylglycerol--glycerol-3-phosphate 3-phosphatidyltransferase